MLACHGCPQIVLISNLFGVNLIREQMAIFDRDKPRINRRALLAGLLRCGHRTRRMQVRDNRRAAGYQCRGACLPTMC